MKNKNSSSVNVSAALNIYSEKFAVLSKRIKDIDPNFDFNERMDKDQLIKFSERISDQTKNKEFKEMVESYFEAKETYGKKKNKIIEKAEKKVNKELEKRTEKENKEEEKQPAILDYVIFKKKFKELFPNKNFVHGNYKNTGKGIVNKLLNEKERKYIEGELLRITFQNIPLTVYLEVENIDCILDLIPLLNNLWLLKTIKEKEEMCDKIISGFDILNDKNVSLKKIKFVFSLFITIIDSDFFSSSSTARENSNKSCTLSKLSEQLQPTKQKIPQFPRSTNNHLPKELITTPEKFYKAVYNFSTQTYLRNNGLVAIPKYTFNEIIRAMFTKKEAGKYMAQAMRGVPSYDVSVIDGASCRDREKLNALYLKIEPYLKKEYKVESINDVPLDVVKYHAFKFYSYGQAIYEETNENTQDSSTQSISNVKINSDTSKKKSNENNTGKIFSIKDGIVLGIGLKKIVQQAQVLLIFIIN